MKRNTHTKSPLVTRRQVLSLLGLGTLCCRQLDPISMVTRSLVDGLIANAQAQTAAPVKNFVSILYPFAPTRWVWDGFLSPNNETIVRNGTVNTWLNTDTYNPTLTTNAAYRVELVTLPGGRTIYLPPIWNRNIPTSNGSSVPMKNLLDNTMIMRGVDMLFDLGHVKGPAKVLFPLGSDASLTGLVGDASQTPMPVIGMSGNRVNYADPSSQGYKSLSGTTPVLVNLTTGAGAPDPLSATISPFLNTDPATLANSTKLNSPVVQLAIKDALDSLGSYAKSSLPGSDVLYKNATSATKLFQTAFGDLRGVVYPTLYNKYLNLVTRCARTAIPNILPATGTAGYNLAAGAFSRELVFQFAVAEYLLTSGLSSAISICADYHVLFGGLENRNDEHDYPDRQKSMMCHTFQFLALSSMVYELRRVLMAKGQWNNTLFHISSEFSRLPRADLSGTDHASNSNVVTMMSGAIKQPIFVGNIKTDSNPGSGIGTYGAAAPVITNSGRITVTNNVAASTVATILGVQSPNPTAPSIVAVDATGNNVTLLAEAPKNV